MTPTSVTAKQAPLHITQDADIRFGTLKTRCVCGTGGIVNLDSGAAGTVLALHSLGLDRHAFDRLRGVLPSRWRVISFDQRGHGTAATQHAEKLDTYAEDANAALATCGDEPVHLLGHSMGGVVAALMAATMNVRAPGRIASLALVATPAAGNAAFAERGASALADGMAAVIDVTLARWFNGRHTPADAIAYATATLRAMQPAGFAAAWSALAGFAGYSDIALNLPPTLCIAAADDLSTPPAAMRLIVDAFAAVGRADAVTFSTVAGAGHMALLTAAPAIAPLLEAHWQLHSKKISKQQRNETTA